MKRWIFTLLCIGLAPGTASSQIFGVSARTEFFGALGVRIFYGHVHKTRFLQNSNRVHDPNTPEVTVSSVPVALVYGVRPRLSLIATVPTLTRTVKRTVSGRRVSETNRGIGDIQLFAKYRFYKKDGRFKTRQFALQLGLKLPTGDDDLSDGQGNRFPQPLQLGSGSTDARFVLSLTEVHGRVFLTGDLGYTLKTAAHNFRSGNAFHYDLAAKIRLYPVRYTDRYPTRDLFAFLELNGSIAQKARSGPRTLPDSGGHQVFLAPGLQFFPTPNLLLEAGVQIPIWEDLNGAQLGTDFHFRTGLRWFIWP